MLTALALFLSPIHVAAHPHVFIDAGVSFIFNDTGELFAVKIEWAYDDLFTLFTLEDLGLDTDGDGIITIDEQKKLVGFDTQWIDGFEGDSYLTFAERKVSLGKPHSSTAKLVDGRLITSHIRKISQKLKITKFQKVKSKLSKLKLKKSLKMLKTLHYLALYLI